mmetsp:Transcript_6474/g.15679  ORF Transcript_6474/g.15679 Transcript_6474/m.15679 type:complete len:166 (+) Transcript_6474:46-543(+)
MFKRFQGLLRQTQKHFTGKTLVGTDKHGNRFVLFEPSKDSPPRRMVEPVGGVYERDGIHKLWSMWLSSSRDEPPSQEEMDKYDEAMDQLNLRVQKVNETDEKLRLQERMERAISDEGGSQQTDVNIAGMFEAMNRDHTKSGTGGGNSSGTGKFVPQGWDPNSSKK